VTALKVKAPLIWPAMDSVAALKPFSSFTADLRAAVSFFIWSRMESSAGVDMAGGCCSSVWRERDS
jgi:hypothetical protein